MDKNKEINNLIPNDLKLKFKELIKKFNIPVAPIAPAAPVAPAPAVTLQEATLQDGTVLKYDTPTLTAGSVVSIVSPEGEMPAPEGELTLQDGSVIKVVSKDGKSVVESLTPPAAPAAPAVQAAAPVVPSIAPQLAQMKSDFEAKFKAESEEKEAIKTLFDSNKKELDELKTKFNGLMEFLSEVMDLPTAAPIEPPANKRERKTNINRFINR